MDPTKVDVQHGYPPTQSPAMVCYQCNHAYTANSPLSCQSTKPVQVVCPNCRQFVNTSVEKRMSLVGWFFFAWGLFCLPECCCCVYPFVMDEFKHCDHKCSSCGTYIWRAEDV